MQSKITFPELSTKQWIIIAAIVAPIVVCGGYVFLMVFNEILNNVILPLLPAIIGLLCLVGIGILIGALTGNTKK